MTVWTLSAQLCNIPGWQSIKIPFRLYLNSCIILLCFLISSMDQNTEILQDCKTAGNVFFFNALTPYVITVAPAGELFPLAHFTYHSSHFCDRVCLTLTSPINAMLRVCGNMHIPTLCSTEINLNLGLAWNLNKKCGTHLTHNNNTCDASGCTKGVTLL